MARPPPIRSACPDMMFVRPTVVLIFDSAGGFAVPRRAGLARRRSRSADRGGRRTHPRHRRAARGDRAPPPRSAPNPPRSCSRRCCRRAATARW
ncbi:MAG: hypothetical protein WDN44_10460 [Sphingomonas sp.]